MKRGLPDLEFKAETRSTPGNFPGDNTGDNMGDNTGDSTGDNTGDSTGPLHPTGWEKLFTAQLHQSATAQVSLLTAAGLTHTHEQRR